MYEFVLLLATRARAQRHTTPPTHHIADTKTHHTADTKTHHTADTKTHHTADTKTHHTSDNHFSQDTLTPNPPPHPPRRGA